MLNIQDFKKVKIDKLSHPKRNGLYKLYYNFYWAVTDDDCVIFYRKSNTPQCNQNEKIMCHNLGLWEGIKEIKLIEYIFVPIHSNFFEHQV